MLKMPNYFLSSFSYALPFFIFTCCWAGGSFPHHFPDIPESCWPRVVRARHVFGSVSGAADVGAYLISSITGAPTSQSNSTTQGASVLVVLTGTPCWWSCFTKSHESYSGSAAATVTGTDGIKGDLYGARLFFFYGTQWKIKSLYIFLIEKFEKLQQRHETHQHICCPQRCPQM